MARKQMIELIRYLLEHGGKTRNQIASETGLDPAALCRIVQGKTACTVETAQKILDLFGYEITRKKKRGTVQGSRTNEKRIGGN